MLRFQWAPADSFSITLIARLLCPQEETIISHLCPVTLYITDPIHQQAESWSWVEGKWLCPAIQVPCLAAVQGEEFTQTEGHISFWATLHRAHSSGDQGQRQRWTVQIILHLALHSRALSAPLHPSLSFNHTSKKNHHQTHSNPTNKEDVNQGTQLH